MRLQTHLVRESMRLLRAQEAFLQCVGGDEAAAAKREREIRALPLRVFKGRPLRETICPLCKRPRNYWPSQLWLMIDLNHVLCPWCSVRG